MRPIVCTQSLIDDNQLQIIQVAAAIVKEQLAAGQYIAARQTWSALLYQMRVYTTHVDSYNFRILHKPETDKRTLLEHGK